MGKLIFILLVTCGFSAMAQTTTSINQSSTRAPSTKTRTYIGDTPARFEGVVGINNSKLLADGEDSSVKDGYTLGVLANLGKGPAVFETGLLYMQMGGAAGGARLQISYIAVPLFAKVFASPKQIGFYGKAGAMLAKLRSSEISIKTADGRAERDFEKFTKDEDFMYGVGLGYVFDTGTAYAMSIELNYLRGDHKVLENLGSGADSVRNESVSMRAGIRL